MKRVARSGQRMLALGGAAALLLAGCSTAPPPDPASPAPQTSSASASPAPALDRYYSQALDWQPCDGSFECADVSVPIDYADPDAGDTTFAVIRQTPVDRPLGYLVLNPGGPGGSGVDYAKAASSVVSPRVAQSYNVVGFDPRGVAHSNPIDCLTDRQLDAWIGGDSDPDTPAQVRQLLAKAKAFGERCAAAAPELVAHVDTGSVVKDLDVLRAALGSEKLNYLGFSYGSLIGARYDQEFGQHVGRMVLDGVISPDLSQEDVALGQAEAFEQSLRRFVADCQAKPNCPLGGDVDAGVARIRRFLTSLEGKPLRTRGDRPLTEALAAGAILYYLYFPYGGDWNRLSQGLRSAFDGDGTLLLAMLDERLQRGRDGNYADNGQEVFYAVNCLDRRVAGRPEDLAALAQRWSQAAPTFGRYLAWSEAVCLQWPVPATGQPQQATAESGNAPIVLVATAHDPATPPQWARRLAESNANAHLVVWESDGHTAYTNGSSCVDGAVDSYLLDGTVPEAGLRCT